MARYVFEIVKSGVVFVSTYVGDSFREACAIRSQHAQEVRNSAKIWIAQTRIGVKAQLQPLISKVDLAVGALMLVEADVSKARSREAFLECEARGLQRLVLDMVPSSTLTSLLDSSSRCEHQLATLQRSHDHLNKQHAHLQARLQVRVRIPF